MAVEDYDAVARADCPDLWQQAKTCGFDELNWIVSCREDYWMTYCSVLGGYQSEKNQELIILEVVNKENRLAEINYNYEYLKGRFEYEHHREQSPVPESVYVEQAFKTLSVLNEHKYLSKENLLWVKLQPSHWQLQKKLPSLQALPNIKPILSLFEPIKGNEKYFVHLPHNFKKDEFNVYLKKYHEEYLESSNRGLSESVQKELSLAFNKQEGEEFFKQFSDISDLETVKTHILPLHYVKGSKPVFMFAPLTGETPDDYRNLREAVIDQTVYVFQTGLNETGRDSEKKATISLCLIMSCLKI